MSHDNKQTKSILIATGGTGGHIFPGIALARVFQACGYKVTWVGTQKGLEAKLVPQANIPIDFLQITGVRGKSFLSLLFAPFKLLLAIQQAYQILKRRKPDLVIGLGGFVFGPTGIAAFLLGIPLVLHEQNSVAGMTNCYLSFVAKRVFSSFPDAFAPSSKVLVTGNPVRAEILALPEVSLRFKAHTGALRILVLGGSQGAIRINEVLPEALSLLTFPVNVRHQCGESSYEKTLSAYQALNIEAQVEKFIDDMAQALSWADIVICRAGATTIAELIAAGLGALLIPYPYAVDDHQTKNGLYLVKAQAAIILAQQSLTAAVLAEKLSALTREQCEKMALAAHSLYQGDATKKIIDSCEEILNG